MKYMIIGSDLRRYGPATADQIRQWMAEGRVNSETRIQPENSVGWVRLAEVPELGVAGGAAEPLAQPPPTPAGRISDKCPNCGEAFEANFDSCWRCGTRLDGSPGDWEAADGVGIASELPADAVASSPSGSDVPSECPHCHGQTVIPGTLRGFRHSVPRAFQPDGPKLLVTTFEVRLASDHSFACSQCGLVWNYANPLELQDYMANVFPAQEPPGGMRLPPV